MNRIPDSTSVADSASEPRDLLPKGWIQPWYFKAANQGEVTGLSGRARSPKIKLFQLSYNYDILPANLCPKPTEGSK
jgi:hypothetical protein